MSLFVLLLLHVSSSRHYVSVSFFFALLFETVSLQGFSVSPPPCNCFTAFLSCFAFLWLFRVFITI